MKKQLIQFGVVIVILVLCIGGYFGISKYFSDKEENKKADTVVAFELEDYKNATAVSYLNSGEQISLSKKNETWSYSEDASVNLSSSVIEGEMLAQLASVEAVQKIDKPEDITQYGFEIDDKGSVEPATNTIVVVDRDGNTHTLYIGDQNPYDSSQYYMMVEGDDNVYVTDSTLADAFSKSVEDITEEETTVEETTVEETSIKETK
ncbi:MAG: DUF4340 domain-containing protein [Eubacterium sp.]